MRRKLLPLLLAGLLSACTLPVRNIPPPDILALEPLEAAQPQAQAVDGSIIVALPSTTPELDTSRVALKKGSTAWDYYAGAKWPDFLPIVVRDDVAKTVARAHLFKAVVTDESPASDDLMLKTEIQMFQADYRAGSATPVIKIRMAVSLVSRLERRPLASFTLNAEKKAAGNTLSAIQAAFSAAFNNVQQQLVAKLGEAAQ